VISTTCPTAQSRLWVITTTAASRGSRKAIAAAGDPWRRWSAIPYRQMGARPSTTTRDPRGICGGGGSGSAGVMGAEMPMG